MKPVLTALCIALLSSTTCAALDDDRIAALEKRVAAIEEYIQVTTEGH